MKKRNIIVIVSIVVFSVVFILCGFYLISDWYRPRTHTFYDTGITDEEYIEIASQTLEAQKFLEKYPNATIWVERSGRLAVDYRVNTNDAYIRLRVFIDPEKNEPSEMFLEINGTYIRKNIIEHLQ